jgi:acetate kinase
MAKFLYLVLVFLTLNTQPSFAQTQKMMSISEATKGLNLSKPDNSTIGFIGTRCGVLYMTISGYFASNANKDSDRKIAEDFYKRSEIFSFVGIYVDTSVNKKTNDAINAQGDALSKAYIEEMLAGKRLNNDVFTKLIGEDVKFCTNQLSAYMAIYKTIYDSAGKGKN